MWIVNASRYEISVGEHRPVDNTVLIQIGDPATEFPIPKAQFVATYQFEFLDVSEHETQFSEFMITDQQASEIVDILKLAASNKQNVMVHCVAGLCRSGAVTEVGVMMGFEDTHRYRNPNVFVKKMLMRQLGWTYD
jgi:predicted protein tyrosine phosphatase